MKKTKTAVIGVGMVGGALANVLSEPLLYDKYKKLGSLKEINRAEIIFICVPTPFDGQKGFDLSYIKNAFKLIKGKKIMVIKSTVLPGTTELFQKKYPGHKVLFSPEFLTEATADQDMRYPDRQIIGYTKKSYNVAKDILQILPLAPFERIMPAAEAELVKYFGNCWFSVKVVYANQMYDLCQKLGINYESVMESAAADKRIGRSHLEIFHKGYRGYGEKCLPKDIRALIQKGDELGIDLKLLKTAEEINKILTEGRDR
ncbi:MAG: hypothetical protein A3I88_02625 [Candidatus Portnoybacteria bacterium RIFCSPLOWO2_12_FULL_39_9]|uniref:UDP-glucose/GDP-mannose dehydrogenase dimerisation domain-containing protein n=1 Tax=Candidatus Portnoybacteria bacterium RIFCSPHIGHO2_12_FULL_38_9 TaxID=1801997 RepID=A0A1G2FH64_9BACT|nr:MAG: hypothetical protein A3H00_00610 [Candidatus Portnoybacteria bacterium RBG_13_40_8]OGZ35757.1 MAG: hypothetical protein A2646_02975 [Candidatus Portnoybacteria bacterium RIFCSPHIGHO2_02_FULL_39_12]OGZ37132.1 MAG: hypothetical protein A3J64_01300 [Candidatus Portnoybacteria bacterium RIFCSPHIGHO2_12_FULL_38_9]OGZ38194.1 MAG: hypothetical protein A3F21_01865 [Candidatus Portnoybacteria bacterium RIFCSPLOWO2_01_FULL_38_39]OGZ39730.1 MAG: hypothetical protein A3I88_02625 [Candidatus Portnoy